MRHRGAEHAKGIQQGDPRTAQTVLPAFSSGFLDMVPKNGWISPVSGLSSYVTGISVSGHNTTTGTALIKFSFSSDRFTLSDGLPRGCFLQAHESWCPAPTWTPTTAAHFPSSDTINARSQNQLHLLPEKQILGIGSFILCYLTQSCAEQSCKALSTPAEHQCAH